jgi:hypothetical protein
MAVRLLVALFFAAYLVEQSPHLVHHLFERGDVQADCTFLSTADRDHAVLTDTMPAVAPLAGMLLPMRPPPAWPPCHDARVPGARAPPEIA